jgi:hypothetical protein
MRVGDKKEALKKEGISLVCFRFIQKNLSTLRVKWMWSGTAFSYITSESFHFGIIVIFNSRGYIVEVQSYPLAVLKNPKSQ